MPHHETLKQQRKTLKQLKFFLISHINVFKEGLPHKELTPQLIQESLHMQTFIEHISQSDIQAFLVELDSEIQCLPSNGWLFWKTPNPLKRCLMHATSTPELARFFQFRINQLQKQSKKCLANTTVIQPCSTQTTTELQYSSHEPQVKLQKPHQKSFKHTSTLTTDSAPSYFMNSQHQQNLALTQMQDKLQALQEENASLLQQLKNIKQENQSFAHRFFQPTTMPVHNKFISPTDNTATLASPIQQYAQQPQLALTQTLC